MLPPAQLRLHRWLARQADGVIAVSTAARARLLAFGVPPQRISVALQSADLEPVRAAAAGRRRTTTTHSRSSSVGRLVPDKNLATLLRAFAQARLSPEEAQLHIAGTGFLEDELRRLGRDLAVPVRFAGSVPPGDLPRLYADADIYAAVSIDEPFGVTIREAAAAGLPLICSSVAGAAGDVAIDGRNADPDRSGPRRSGAGGPLKADQRQRDAAADGRREPCHRRRHRRSGRRRVRVRSRGRRAAPRPLRGLITGPADGAAPHLAASAPEQLHGRARAAAGRPGGRTTARTRRPEAPPPARWPASGESGRRRRTPATARRRWQGPGTGHRPAR